MHCQESARKGLLHRRRAEDTQPAGVAAQRGDRATGEAAGTGFTLVANKAICPVQPPGRTDLPEHYYRAVYPAHFIFQIKPSLPTGFCPDPAASQREPWTFFSAVSQHCSNRLVGTDFMTGSSRKTTEILFFPIHEHIHPSTARGCSQRRALALKTNPAEA